MGSTPETPPPPYFQRGNVTLYYGDCREVLPAVLQPGSVDLLLADPPYGETSLDWDAAVAGWTAALMPLLKPSGSLWCFGSLRFFMEQRDEFAGWKHAQDVVWEKHNGSSFHADRFKRVHELAAQFYPASVPWGEVYKKPVTTPDATKRQVRRKQRPPHTGHIEASSYTSEDGGPRLMRSVIFVRSCHGYAEHPTQKPTGIVIPLLEYSCPPRGLAVSPFAGSGTDLDAARLLGMRAVGCEVDERNCEKIARRLSQETLPLFDVA